MLDVVRSWTDQLLEDHMGLRRRKSLASFMTGMIEARSLVSAEIGKAIPSEAEDKHKIKQADRFLGNPEFDTDAVSRALLSNFSFVKYERVLLTLDWTKLGKACWLMTTSVVTGSRALPFQWTVIDKNRTRIADGQKRHVAKLLDLLPADVHFILLFDAGYDDVVFLKHLQKLHLDVVVRISPSVSVRPLKAIEEPEVAEDGWLNLLKMRLERERVYDWGQVEYTKGQVLPGFRFIGVHDTGQKDPWLLLTNLQQDSRLVIRMYGRRFETEESFKDMKDVRAGFQLKGTRIQNPLRLERLVAAFSLSYQLMVLVGVYGEENLLHRGMQANTVKDRRVLALWRVGRNLLRKGRVTRVNFMDLLRALLGRLSVSFGGGPCPASG